jgi:hypothetical protein
MMAGWIRGIREVREVEVPEDEDKVGVQRGPVVMRKERVISDLPASAWELTVVFAGDLPTAKGAGPCGTGCTYRPVGWWALRWSRLHLVAPLRLFYESYEPPMRFGAKPGPRGRKAA